MEQIKEFADEWNQYSKGYASKRLIFALYKERSSRAVDQESYKVWHPAESQKNPAPWCNGAGFSFNSINNCIS